MKIRGKVVGNTTATPMKIPDWNQNDERRADYIKNRTHYTTDEEVLCDITFENVTTLGFTIDGVIDLPNDDIGWTDIIAEEVINGEKHITRISGMANEFITSSLSDGYYNKETGEVRFWVNEPITGSLKWYRPGKTVPLDEKYIPDTIARKTDISNADMSQNDSTKPDYVKNRTHYTEFESWGEVAFTLEDSTEYSDGYQAVILNKPLEVGKEYHYECDKGKGTFVLVENDNTETCGVNLGDHYAGSCYKDNSSLISFYVGHNVEGYIKIGDLKYHTLADEFISDTIARVADVEAMIGIVNDELESILNGGVD